jgi:hypothetical protein
MQGKSLKFNTKYVVPMVLLAWLLVSLSFTVLIPRADATHVVDGSTRACPHNNTEAMTDVYSPERFRILNLCQKASGVVTFFEVWGDGDWNVYVRLDEASRNLVDGSGISKLRAWSQAGDHGDGSADMIWEAIPRDVGESGKNATTGPLTSCRPSPDSRGDQATVYGVYVADKWHGWKEIHPITQITYDGQTCTRSEPTSTETSGGGGNCKETWGWGGRNRC